LVTGLSWLGLIDVVGERIYRLWVYVRARRESMKLTQSIMKEVKVEKIQQDSQRSFRNESLAIPAKVIPIVIPKPVVVAKVEAPRERKKIELDPAIKLEPGSLPSFTLLNPTPPVAEKAFASISFEELSQLVEQRLSDFSTRYQS
jgi:hypothetical protein